jgi:hypothetical protein
MVESNPFYETKSSFFTLTKNNIFYEAKQKINYWNNWKDYKDIILEKFPNANIKIYEDYIYSIEALKIRY